MSRAIASKRSARARLRTLAAACTVAAALAAATAMSSPALRAADSPAATAAPKHHRHRGPTPTPTPIALPAGIQVPTYAAGPFPYHDGDTLVYQASWLGIPAATARIKLHKSPKDPNLWVAEAWIETNRFVDIFFRMRDYMRERFAATSLQTRDCYIRQQERKTLNEYDVSFDRAKRLVTMVKRNHKGLETREFIASDPWGPISGAMMALTQPLEPGRRYVFDVYTGNNRYVLDFKIDQRERVRVPLGDFDAYRITPGIVYLSNSKLMSQARETRVWVSADKPHVPLRLEAAAFIGYVRADLIEIDGEKVATR
jgi:phage anti-repressor protein